MSSAEEQAAINDIARAEIVRISPYLASFDWQPHKCRGPPGKLKTFDNRSLASAAFDQSGAARSRQVRNRQRNLIKAGHPASIFNAAVTRQYDRVFKRQRLL